MKRYIIIEKTNPCLLHQDKISEHEMNEAWEGTMIIIDAIAGKVMFGTDWISFKEYNEYIESGEAQFI